MTSKIDFGYQNHLNYNFYDVILLYFLQPSFANPCSYIYQNRPQTTSLTS